MKLLVLSCFLLASQLVFAQGGRGGKSKPKEITSLEQGIAVYVGQVEVAETVNQLAPFAGRVVRQLVMPGTLVKRGQAIIVLSQKSLGEAYADFTTTANLAGVVNEFHVAPGDEFSANQPLFTILDTSRHRIRIAVSNKDHAQIEVNNKVQIVAESQQIKTEGTVSRKSLVPIAGSSLFPIEINVTKDVPIGTFCQIIFEAPQRKHAAEGKGN